MTDYVWRKPKSQSKKYNLDALHDANTIDSFKFELSNRFLPLIDCPSIDVECLSESMNNHIVEAADKILPPVPSPTPLWMHADTKKAIENKKVVRKKYGDASRQYKVAKSETKKLVKRDKINHLNDELDEISNLPPDKQFFLAMKKLKTHKRNISWGIKDKNGKILTSKEDILERWATFYEELYDDPNVCDPLSTEGELPIPPITVSEIVNAINKIPVGKSPGIDNIYSEFSKAGGDTMVSIRHKLFNLILETGEIHLPLRKLYLSFYSRKMIVQSVKTIDQSVY